MDVLLNNDVETVDFGESAMRVKLTREVIEVKEINDIGSVRILMLKGEKGDVGYPTEEQIYDAVDEWLTNHPEATTTVQDNSLTWVKFNDVLKNMMFKLGITDSKSGELVSTSDAAEFPLKDLQSEITATQNLNGYEYPWVGGAGKNLVEYDNANNPNRNSYSYSLETERKTVAEKTNTGGNFICQYKLKLESGKTYYISAQKKANSVAEQPNIYIYSDRLWGNAIAINVGGAWTSNYTGDAVLGVYINNPLGTIIEISDVQVTEGTELLPWTPYENICPISGRTEVNVTRTGANVWDEEWKQGDIVSSSGIEVTGDKVISKNYCEIKPNTSYYIIAPSEGNMGVFYYDESKTFISMVWSANRAITTPSNAKYFKLRFPSQYGTSYANDGGLLYPSTATAYEPYEGDNFNTELGRTVYGGVLDLTTGVLTVNTGLIASYNGETIGEPWISDRDRYVAGTTPTVGAQVVYTKDSETYQVDRTEVDAYFKNNTIWSDTGDVTVSYLVDAKTYIDNQ